MDKRRGRERERELRQDDRSPGRPAGPGPRGPWQALLLRPGRIVKGLWNEIGDDHLTVVAAGVAFYALLAVVPAIAALISIYGLVSEPTDVERQLAEFRSILPAQVYELLVQQLRRIAGESSNELSLGLVGAFLLSVWSANRGMSSLISAVNIAYDEKDRDILPHSAISLLFTFGGIVAFALTLGLFVAVPGISRLVGWEEEIKWLFSLARWPVLFAFILLGLSMVYYFAPQRRVHRWRWASPGAVIATVLLLLSSWAFSLYVTNLGDYSEVYGPLGAVVVLLMWFFIGSFVIVLGAEIDSLVFECCRGRGHAAREMPAKTAEQQWLH